MRYSPSTVGVGGSPVDTVTVRTSRLSSYAYTFCSSSRTTICFTDAIVIRLSESGCW